MLILMRFVSTVLLAITLFSPICQAENRSQQGFSPLPSNFIGPWQVTVVHIDQGMSRWNQTRDDPYNIYKFLGRVVTFSPTQVIFNTPYDKSCEAPRVSPRNSTAAQIIAHSIASRFPDPTPPTPDDLQLPLPAKTTLEVLYLVCKDGLYSKDIGMQVLENRSNAVWFIVLDQNQLAMSWHEQTVLILKRLSDKATAVASFDCGKAKTAVEKTICGSVALAAYDLSVSQTYRATLAYYQSKKNTQSFITALKQSQKTWLRQRDACGAEVACLEKTMSERIDDLDQELALYIYNH